VTLRVEDVPAVRQRVPTQGILHLRCVTRSNG
jgi:hypothetical protein